MGIGKKQKTEVTVEPEEKKFQSNFEDLKYDVDSGMAGKNRGIPMVLIDLIII